MTTETIIRRGKPIRNTKGEIIGFEKGTKETKVTTDPTRSQIIDVATGKAFTKTTRTTDSKGKIITSAKSEAQTRTSKKRSHNRTNTNNKTNNSTTNQFHQRQKKKKLNRNKRIKKKKSRTYNKRKTLRRNNYSKQEFTTSTTRKIN